MKTIPLSQGLVAFVDDEDFEEVSQFRWHARWGGSTFYASRNIQINGKWTSLRMHRDILKLSSEQFADHRDGNGLNNTRANLRIATRSENNRNVMRRKNNSSGFKGVCFDSNAKKYRAYIAVDGKQHHLGLFLTPEEAHAAYCTAAQQFHKEFARVA